MNYFNFSHSSGLKPTRTKLSVTTNGRFTNLPLVANSAICSSSLIAGSFSLSFSSLYTNPLVLKNFFTCRPLRGIHAFNSSTVGFSSTIKRLVNSMLFSVNHFLAFWHVLKCHSSAAIAVPSVPSAVRFVPRVPCKNNVAIFIYNLIHTV